MQTLRLERGLVTIGRGADCDLVLQDTQVSRHHAELRRYGAQWLIVDLGSTNGTVLVNDIDLYRKFDLFRNEPGYVPRKDIVHAELSVNRVLDYAAQLRMPADTSPAERKKRIDEVLDDLDLTERKDLPIHKLPGGQLKRVSIGVELLTKPRLFFLDEPASGLDPGTEYNMMKLLRRLADQGRTIVLVAHASKRTPLPRPSDLRNMDAYMDDSRDQGDEYQDRRQAQGDEYQVQREEQGDAQADAMKEYGDQKEDWTRYREQAIKGAEGLLKAVSKGNWRSFRGNVVTRWVWMAGLWLCWLG